MTCLPNGLLLGKLNQLREPSWAGLTLGILLVVMMGGCGKSASDAEAPVDLRGSPINAAVSSATTPDSPASNRHGNLKTGLASNAASTAAPATGGIPLAGFDRLSAYSIEVSNELFGPVTNEVEAATAKVESMIPEAVRALNDRRMWLRGFMLPLKVEGGLVTELLIMKDQSMCCFGTMPKMNEWVSVKMKAEGVKPVMDEPVKLMGMLHVGPMRENGYLIGIYSLDGEKLGPIGEVASEK